MDHEKLLAAARAVDRQASTAPDAGAPADPDVADFMGAFEEDAVTWDDLDPVEWDSGDEGTADGERDGR